MIIDGEKHEQKHQKVKLSYMYVSVCECLCVSVYVCKERENGREKANRI